MKNYLIILGIIFVTYLAITDTMKRFEELDNISVSTPSQIEMKGDMFKSSGKGVNNSLDKNENKPQSPLMEFHYSVVFFVVFVFFKIFWFI